MFSFVITTINNPTLLIDYHKFLKRKGIDHNFIVVPDKKTPASAKETTAKIGGEYLDQDTFGVWNDDARRQEGILRAIKRKDDYIVLLDDDNFIGGDIRAFSRVGNVEKHIAVLSETNWVNCCEFLEGDEVYPRGFVYSRKPKKQDWKVETNQIVVNAGMWLHNPDVDAIYCITKDPRITGLKGEMVLGEKQFCPFNSQNTAILAETLAGYWFPPKFDNSMFKVGRFGDIFAGIFYEKVMHHLGGTVLFGEPMSKHIRNSHNYLKDLEWEMMGMVILDDIVDELDTIRLTSDNWGEALLELLVKLKGTRKETKVYLDWYRTGVEKWLKAL